MSGKFTLSLLTLPIEIVYRILDNLEGLEILLSVRNVCTRLNAITDTYHPYQTFTVLRWLSDQISNQKFERLADALRTNTTLTTLDLRRNQIGAEGTQHLANALQMNTTLTTLDVQWNGISDDEKEYLERTLNNFSIRVQL